MLTAAALAGVGGASTPDRARAEDRVFGTRAGPEMREREHEILVTVDHGAATLRVRRTLHNGGARHDQAVLLLDVPERAVATGLRTRGLLRGKATWFEGQLLSAEVASTRYQQLTGIGGYFPKDPALLSWRAVNELVLQVFPVAPGQDKEVEYTFTAPTTYEDGRYRISLPALGSAALPATYVLTPRRRGDALYVDGRPARRGHRITPRVAVEVALARADAPRFDGRLAVVPFGEQRVLTHFDFDVADPVSTVPRGADVVVLIDTSRSRDERAVSASLTAARAFLEHFRGRAARAALISFDRRARVHGAGRLEAVERVLRRADRLDLTQGNGSAVDEALATAERVLEGPGARAGAPRRVVLISDFLPRGALAMPLVHERSRRTGALVHLAEVDAGASSIDRDDRGVWAAVARETGGVMWRGSAEPERATVDEDHRLCFEEWARPVRLDNITISVGDGDAPEDPDALLEGQTVGWFEIAASEPRHVSVRGELWSEPVHEIVVPDAREGARWAALVFGSTLLHELTEPEMMTLALRGRAVSPVTSYLAIEPGVRPSTEGLDDREGNVGTGGLGLIGRGSGGGAGAGYGRRAFDPLRFLQDRLATAWRACGGASRHAAIQLETTYAEIVDVPALTIDGASAPALETCVTEAIWALQLPRDFRHQRKRWDVRV